MPPDPSSAVILISHSFGLLAGREPFSVALSVSTFEEMIVRTYLFKRSVPIGWQLSFKISTAAENI